MSIKQPNSITFLSMNSIYELTLFCSDLWTIVHLHWYAVKRKRQVVASFCSKDEKKILVFFLSNPRVCFVSFKKTNSFCSKPERILFFFLSNRSGLHCVILKVKTNNKTLLFWFGHEKHKRNWNFLTNQIVWRRKIVKANQTRFVDFEINSKFVYS